MRGDQNMQEVVVEVDSEEAVSTAAVLMFHLTVFLFGLAVLGLHLASVESSVRHFAAVDLGRCGSDEKTWTTVPSTTTRTQKEDATTKSPDVAL